MKKIIFSAIVTFALALSSCNSINPKMTWEEFEQSEIVKEQGLEKTEQGLYAKLVQKGEGTECNYLQTLELNIKFLTIDQQELKSYDGTTKLMDVKEKGADDIAKIIYEMKEGGVKEAYVPSELAQKAGMIDNVDYPVVKAIITLKKIEIPSWNVEIDGKTTMLKQGMSVADVYGLLGKPFDGQREDALGLLIFQYKDAVKHKVYGLNFENEKLSSVDETQL